MNLKIPIIFLGVYEISRMGLVYAMAQTPDIPGGLWDVAKEFPGLVIAGGAAYSAYYVMKWLDKMLEAQRLALKEVYDSNQIFLSGLLGQIEAKQNKMADRIELLTQQVALINATVSELAKMDDVVERLMDKLERRGSGGGGL
jgi:hypothetical protein